MRGLALSLRPRFVSVTEQDLVLFCVLLAKKQQEKWKHEPALLPLRWYVIPRTTFYPLRDVACSQRVWSKLRLVDDWKKIQHFSRNYFAFQNNGQHDW